MKERTRHHTRNSTKDIFFKKSGRTHLLKYYTREKKIGFKGRIRLEMTCIISYFSIANEGWEQRDGVRRLSATFRSVNQ